MFVPVTCSQCGKPFHVPEASVGQAVVCPWCAAAVLALPVGAPVPTPPTPEPLPLEDISELPRAFPSPAPAAGLPAARRFGWFRLWMVPAGLLVLFVAAVATVGVLRHKQGHLVGWEWREFSPPDKSFAVDLLGRAKEDPNAPAGETRYVTEGWYSGTTAWVGWRDLTQAEKQLGETKDAWRHFGKVYEAARDRLKGQFDGAVVKKDATTQFENPLTHEVRVEYPGGRAVERIVVMPGGRHARVYFVGIAGLVGFDGPEVQRLFDSFRVNE